MTAFWRRMPQFFRFPAYRSPLARNLVLSLAIAGAVALRSPLATSLVALAAAIYLAHYGFIVIERVAQGYLHPDQFPALKAAGPWRTLKLAAILAAAFVAIGLVIEITGDGLLTLLAYAAVALLLPASVMTLAVTGRLRRAIDPRRVFALAQRIGPPYLVLFLFLLLLMGGSQQAFELVAPALGDSLWLLALVSTFVGNYFFLIMCALMGYVLYQYSGALGLKVVGPGEEEAEGPPADAERELGRLIAAGDSGAAVAWLERALRDDPDDVSAHERLHKLLLALDKPERAAAQLDRYLELLLRVDPGRAQAVARAALERDAGWLPSSAVTVALARAAAEARQFDLVLDLTRDFEARHPHDEAAPTVTLLRAEAESAQKRLDAA